MNNIFENINEYICANKLNHDTMNQFDKSVIKNNYEVIIGLIKSNNKIYYNNLLCNGFYKRKCNQHPSKCHDFICYKTPLYYALWLNTLYYSNIFKLLLEVLNLYDLSHFNINNIIDERDKKYIELSEKIKNIYDVMIKINCPCEVLREYFVFYNHDNMNFKIVNNILTKNIVKIIDILESEFGFDYKYPDENTDEIICYKKYIGGLYVYYKNNYIYEKNKLSIITHKLSKYWGEYSINCEIVKLLFNQQAHEYYIHNIINKSYKLDNIIDEIMLNQYVDINYISSSGENIFSLTITQQNKSELIPKIRSYNGVIPKILTIYDIVNKCAITNIKEIVKTCEIDYFENTQIFIKYIFDYEKMLFIDRMEIMELMVQRGIFDNSNYLIQLALTYDRSLNIIEKLSSRKDIMSYSSTQDIYLSMKLKKYRELSLLLKNNNLINEKYEGNVPIINYFTLTKNDKYEDKLMLKTILEYKPNINVVNEDNRNPLVLAILYNKYEAINLLIELCNPYLFDTNGHNALHNAILKNNINAINILQSLESNDIVLANETTQSNMHPLILALTTNNPFNITQALFSQKKININCMSHTDEYILHYILKSSLSEDIKISLFKIYLKYDINLLEKSKDDIKPLVVVAVELNYYDIVVMIMNKLLDTGEIKFNGYVNAKNINQLLDGFQQKNIIVKDSTGPNFYSLVMVYLKNGKSLNKIIDVDMSTFNNNIFIIFMHVIIFILFFMKIMKNN